MQKRYVIFGSIVIFFIGIGLGYLISRTYFNKSLYDGDAFATATLINQHVMLLKLLQAHEYSEAEGFLKRAIATDIEDANTILNLPLTQASHNNLSNRMLIATETLAKPSKSLTELFWGEHKLVDPNSAVKRDAPQAARSLP